MAFPSNPTDGQIHNEYVYSSAQKAWMYEFLYGMTPDFPGLSAKDILDKNPRANVNGVYWVRPNSNPAFPIYCNMETDGGGWNILYSTHSDVVPISENNYFDLVETIYQPNTTEFLWLVQNSNESIEALIKVKFSNSYTDWKNNHTGGNGVVLASDEGPDLDAHWYIDLPSIGVLHNYTKSGIIRATQHLGVYDDATRSLHYKRTNEGEHFPWADGSTGAITSEGYLHNSDYNHPTGGEYFEDKLHSVGFR